jgi:hypothetical protein
LEICKRGIALAASIVVILGLHNIECLGAQMIMMGEELVACHFK